MRLLPCTWIPILSIFLAALSFAQQAPSVQSDPASLARRAVQNEVEASQIGTHYMFRGTRTTPRGSTTKIYVETKEATAGMVVAYNGKALGPEQRRDEEARVERFIRDPEELRKKHRQEQDDAERTMRIVRALPDAFLFEYAGEEQGSAGVGKSGAPLVKLSFRPNPNYQPPSRVEQVLAGMQGELLVDPSRNRLARIDGRLFKDVSFGWGILGHLDKGGRFLVEQEAVGNGDWEISRMSLEFTGKILIFKNVSIQSAEVFSGFKRVPADLTFAQAIELLKKQDVNGDENPPASSLAKQ